MYIGSRFCALALLGCALLAAQAQNPPEHAMLPMEGIRLAPRIRYQALGSGTLPALQPQRIEPFLAEPVVVDAGAMATAPRIVATQDGRVLLGSGDRAYARGPAGAPLLDAPGRQQAFRILRNPTALTDPASGELLGFEARYLGRAMLVRGESTRIADADGTIVEMTPATLDIVAAKEEVRVGDRLLPEPERELLRYVPHPPATEFDGRIVSVYGSAVAQAAQNQIVVVNRGTRDGLERGHVLAVLTAGARLPDRTDADPTPMRLPDERNGLLMVFKTFERLSYALVLGARDGIKVGDRLASPH